MNKSFLAFCYFLTIQNLWSSSEDKGKQKNFTYSENLSEQNDEQSLNHNTIQPNYIKEALGEIISVEESKKGKEKNLGEIPRSSQPIEPDESFQDLLSDPTINNYVTEIIECKGDFKQAIIIFYKVPIKYQEVVEEILENKGIFIKTLQKKVRSENKKDKGVDLKIQDTSVQNEDESKERQLSTTYHSHHSQDNLSFVKPQKTSQLSSTYSLNSINSYKDYLLSKPFLIKQHNAALHLRDSIKFLKQENETHFFTLINNFNQLASCIDTIINSECFKEFPTEENQDLINLYYNLKVDIAAFHLKFLGYSDEVYLNKIHLTGYLNARSTLNNHYKKILKQIYDTLEVNFPKLRQKIYPTFQRPIPQRVTKVSNRRIQLQQENHQINVLKMLKSVTNIETLPLELWSVKNREFSLAIRSISRRALNSSPLSSSKDALKERVQMCKQFLELELMGFSLTFSSEQSDLTPEKMEVDSLVESYKHISSNLPKFDLYGLMKWGIKLLVETGRIQEALIRLKAMEVFYNNTKFNDSKDFKHFQAMAYAVCGNFDKLFLLNKIAIQKELASKREREKKKKQQLEKLKKQLNTTHLSQKKLESSNLIFSSKTKQRQSKNNKLNENQEISEKLNQEQNEQRKKASEDRKKRHEEAEKDRAHTQSSDVSASKEGTKLINSYDLQIPEQLVSPVISASTIPITFPVPGKPYKLLMKIFSNNWKIKRPKLENLFNHLGQTINTSTGSSHHVMKISQAIAVVKEEKIIGIIGDLSAEAGGHISLPNWENEVPFYTQGQILNLLNLMGVTKTNFSKVTEDNHMQVIAIQGRPSASCPPIHQSKNPKMRKNKKNG